MWFDEVYRRIGDRGTHIVTADVPGAEAHDASHANTIHRVSLRRRWWLRPESLGMYARLLAKSLWLGVRHRFDAVHAGRVLPEGLVGLIVARMIGRPLVVYAHGEEITTWRQSGKFRAMVITYTHADRVVANSDFTRDELLKLGVAPERIVLISPGVDLDRFRPGLETSDLRVSLGISEEQKLILSVGRLSRRKGFDQVIRSIPILVQKGIDAHYAIIGIGEDKDYLAALARENGIAERVHRLGHVSPEDLPRWYNAADLVVMANREINGDTEGFGMVFLEAAACGKATVAGLAGGTGAAVVNGETGLRIDGASLEEVAGGLTELLEAPELRDEMGQRGRQRALSEFGWPAVADRTEAIMRGG